MNILDRALAHVAMGISVIPCRGKIPALHAWKQYQTRRPTPITVGQWAAAGLLTNYGVICGQVSNHLVAIDLDGQDAIDLFAATWPSLYADTYRVRTGSGAGMHVYVWTAYAPPTVRCMGLPVGIGNIELRSNGAYVVGAGSVHPDTGAIYEAVGSLADIRRIGDQRLGSITAWIKGLSAAKYDRPAPAPASRPLAGIASADKWAAAALTGECAAVRMAAKGMRNTTLNRAAWKLGQLVAAGKLARHEVEAALTAAAAAYAEDEGDHVVSRTIKSGLEAGIRNPRKG